MMGTSLTNSLTFSLGEMSLGNIAQGQVSRRSDCVCVCARVCVRARYTCALILVSAARGMCLYTRFYFIWDNLLTCWPLPLKSVENSQGYF